MIPNPWLILGAVLAFIGAFVGGNIHGHRAERIVWEKRSAEESLAAFKKGQSLQRAADQVAIDIAGTQTVVQERIITNTIKLKEEVQIYVQDDSNCITYGFMRLHDAAALGVDPATLALPADKSNGSCTTLKWSDLEKGVIGNYGTADQNAGQLTGLQGYVSGVQKAQSGP